MATIRKVEDEHLEIAQKQIGVSGKMSPSVY